MNTMNMNNKTAKDMETITGFVVPEAWDQDFSVTGVLIACEGERDVRVVNLPSHPILFELMGKKASITGTIQQVGTMEQIHIQSVDAE